MMLNGNLLDNMFYSTTQLNTSLSLSSVLLRQLVLCEEQRDKDAERNAANEAVHVAHVEMDDRPRGEDEEDYEV